MVPVPVPTLSTVPIGSLLIKLAPHNFLYSKNDSVLAADANSCSAVFHRLLRVLDLKEGNSRLKKFKSNLKLY